jgi:hypothetical protein
VADRGAGEARVGAGPGAGGAGGIRGTRAEVREGDGDQDSEMGQMSSAGQFWKHAWFIWWFIRS